MPNAHCHKILSFDQISPKLKCGVDEYLCFPCVGTKHIKANGKRVLEVFIHSTVYEEFRVCFAMAKKENSIFCYVNHPMHW